MLKNTLLPLLFVLCAAGVAGAADATWKADLNHSSAQFTAVHLAISHVTGSLPLKSVDLKIAQNSDIPSSIRAELDPSGIDTRVGMRDNDLRSAHFFDVSTYPTMSFESTKITPVDDRHFTVVGNLTMHGVTKPVTLNAQMIGKGPGMRGEPRIAYTASGAIDRTQWGMTYGSFIASNSIDINLEVEAVKQ